MQSSRWMKPSLSISVMSHMTNSELLCEINVSFKRGKSLTVLLKVIGKLWVK